MQRLGHITNSILCCPIKLYKEFLPIEEKNQKKLKEFKEEEEGEQAEQQQQQQPLPTVDTANPNTITNNDLDLDVILGVISIRDEEDHGGFGEEEEKILQVFCHQAALSLLKNQKFTKLLKLTHDIKN